MLTVRGPGVQSLPPETRGDRMPVRMHALEALRPVWWLLAGALVAAGGIAIVRAQPEVYASRVEAVVLPPASDVDGATLNEASSSLIAFAALLERRYDGHRELDRYASPEATLAGGGVTDGSRVQLIDNGGQWASNFNKPVLVIEAVGPSAGVVRQRIDTMIDRLEADTDRLQRGVPDQSRMTLLRPDTVEVDLSTGNHTRAYAAVAALAGFAAVSVGAAGRRRTPLRRRTVVTA
jgi:hypothetical protein